MPTYQYRCPTCGHEFEEFQNMSDEPIRVCPKCQGETHRVISGGIGLIFKGTGFYITDYKKKSGGENETSGSKRHHLRPESSGSSSGSSTESSSAKSEGGTNSSTSSGDKSSAKSSDSASKSSSSSTSSKSKD